MNNRQIFADTEILFKAAAEKFVELSIKAIAFHGQFTVAFSGGNTPQKLYELLALSPYREQVDWKNVFVFWGDERCVPADDKNNNSRMAFEALLNHVSIPAENIFPVPVDKDPHDAAISYEETLALFFKKQNPHFDLILLGLGDNGHTASLFPGTAIVQEKKRLVREVFIDELKMWRISFTAPLINSAAAILFLVTGESKAEIVKAVFSGFIEAEKYPVQLINPSRGSVDWYLDKPAASLLTNS